MERKQLWRRMLASLLLLSSVFALVQAEQLIVEEKSGGKTAYDLGTSPVLTYQGNVLVLKTSEASAEFQIPDLAMYYFKEGSPTDVESLASEGMDIVYLSDNVLYIKNFAPQTLVQVFSVVGVSLGDYRTSDEGALTIDLSNRPNGVYMIKSNLSTIKIVKK
ncbi:MAG: T9SS type A sorting domain-containing protein [Paludibacteraceae bacterium]|nr:T9SS type A sorting domain-containing protein [Paludibacteraceae bacterium]